MEIVILALKKSILCKFFHVKEVCPTFRDRPLKSIRLLGKEICSLPGILLSEFSLTTAMQILLQKAITIHILVLR